jgi:cytochrome c-type biogenesis protein
MDPAFGDFGGLVESAPWLAFAAAFVGGLLTASNPCVLISIPLVMSYVAGNAQAVTWKRSLLYSACMVLGLSVTFTVLGLLSGLLGRFFGVQGRWWPWAIGAVCLIMGLHLLDLLPWKFGFALPFTPSSRGALGAFLLGLLFGVISTPCAVPILAVLLAFIAAKGSVVYGGALLLTYALGHCMLVLLCGVSAGAVRALLGSSRWATANLWLRRGAGVVVILVGGYVVLAPMFHWGA